MMRDDQVVRFLYEPIELALDAFFDELQVPAATRALKKLKFAVLGAAWTDFDIWDPEVDSAQAMAWAWEDMVIALSGYGESGFTGAVVALWATVPRESWTDLQEQLNRAKARADAATPRSVARRYFHTYRKQGVRTPDDGFKLPCLTPTSGPRLREWAAGCELDPDTLEVQMMQVEELERLGIINLGDDLRVVKKGCVVDLVADAISLADQVIENPFALDAQGRPGLRLVTTDDD